MDEKLPRYTFVGPEQDLDVLAATVNHLDTFKASLPPEIAKSPEHIDRIKNIQGSIEAFGADLGLDVSDRTISVDDIHLFDPEQFAKIRKKFNQSDEWHGGQLSTGEVIVDGDLDSPTTWSRTNHELLHGYSHSPRRVSYENGGITIDATRRGYAVGGVGGAFHVFDEVVAEKMNQYVQENYWHDSLEQLKGGDSAYITATPVIEGLVRRIADDQQQSEDILWKELFRGEMTGDVRMLRKVYDSIGTEGMRILANYRESSATNAAKVASALGVVAFK